MRGGNGVVHFLRHPVYIERKFLSWRHDGRVCKTKFLHCRHNPRRACSEENWSCRNDGTDLKCGTNTRGTANLVRTFGYC
jgi:hypothetical protein